MDSISANSTTLMTAKQYHRFLEIYTVFGTIMSIAGLMGNVVNVKTFLAMGIDDGMTLSFLVMSISDLCFILAMITRTFCTIFLLIEIETGYRTWFKVDPYGLFIWSTQVLIMVYLYTVLITTFLATARCMCIIKPFYFKNTFTKTLSAWILVIFVVITLITYVPLFHYMEMISVFDSKINATRPILWISPKREVVKDVLWGIRDVFLVSGTHIIIIVCVVLTAKGLRTAAKFRQSSASAPECSQDNQLQRSEVSHGKIKRRNNLTLNSTAQKTENPSLERKQKLEGGSNTKFSKIGVREIQLVQQVILISSVYLICFTPKILVMLLGFIEVDYTLGRRYHYIYMMSMSFLEFFQLINASVNILIYYNYNSKFRQFAPAKMSLFCGHAL